MDGVPSSPSPSHCQPPPAAGGPPSQGATQGKERGGPLGWAPLTPSSFGAPAPPRRQVPSLFMLTSKHFFSRQARHWFLCVLSTGQPPCKAKGHRGEPNRAGPSRAEPSAPETATAATPPGLPGVTRGCFGAQRVREGCAAYLVPRFAHVGPVPPDAPLEKPRAAIAGVHPVVLPGAAVPAHFAGDVQNATCKRRRERGREGGREGVLSSLTSGGISPGAAVQANNEVIL